MNFFILTYICRFPKFPSIDKKDTSRWAMMAMEKNRWKLMWIFCYITIYYIILGTWIKSACTDWILCMIKTLAHKNVLSRFLFFLILEFKQFWLARGEWLTEEWILHVWNTRYLASNRLIFLKKVIVKIHTLEQKMHFV